MTKEVNKFNVGDVVIRTEGTFWSCIKGELYIVHKIRGNGESHIEVRDFKTNELLLINGNEGQFLNYGFELVTKSIASKVEEELGLRIESHEKG